MVVTGTIWRRASRTASMLGLGSKPSVRHHGQLATALGQECLLDLRLPADGLQDFQRLAGAMQNLGDLANAVLFSFGGVAHGVVLLKANVADPVHMLRQPAHPRSGPRVLLDTAGGYRGCSKSVGRSLDRVQGPLLSRPVQTQVERRLCAWHVGSESCPRSVARGCQRHEYRQIGSAFSEVTARCGRRRDRTPVFPIAIRNCKRQT